jgi:hypothetical protein
VIEEIKMLMLRSTQDTVSKGKLRRRDPAIVARKKQQQQQRNGAYGQLQKIVWDPRGFQ